MGILRDSLEVFLDHYQIARGKMIRNQILSRGVRDTRIVQAFLDVPRHEFVDQAFKSQAYSDNALPLFQGQTISQPYIVAIMTELLEIEAGHKVLEIGTGSGYQSAILHCLTDCVYSVERVPELVEKAQENLLRAGIQGVRIRQADGTLGWPEEAPFDRIIVTAGAPEVPAPLVAQLADRGRLIVPVGNRTQQRLALVSRQNGTTTVTYRDDCVFVPLLGRAGWQGPA